MVIFDDQYLTHLKGFIFFNNKAIHFVVKFALNLHFKYHEIITEGERNGDMGRGRFIILLETASFIYSLINFRISIRSLV